MISVKRVESGKIVHGDFRNSVDLVADGWQYHPSLDRFFMDLTDGSLNILHGNVPAYLFRELPETAVMEMRNNYNPSEVYDYGGFVAYITEEQKLELYEYYNDLVGTAQSFPLVRMIKRGDEYEGYGSQDGRNWDIRGSVEYKDATKWGVALEGNAGDTLKIQTLTVYKDTSVRFRALPLGSRVELWCTESATPELVGTIENSGYEGDISVFGFPMPLKANIKVYEANGTLSADDDYEELFGGDVFHCGNFLEVYYNDKPLDTYQNDFGYLNDFYKDFKLEIRNMIDVPHTNVNVEIKQYLAEFGWEWVEICKDVGGIPDGQFKKVLSFDVVDASGSVFFWIRITRSTVPVKVDDYLFDFAINIW